MKGSINIPAVKQLTLLALLVAGLSSCGSDNAKETKKKPSAISTENQDEITLTPQRIKVMGIQLGEAHTRSVSEEIKVNGRVDLPPGNRATISLPLAGKIGQVKVLPGQAVRKGELLATMESFEFIQIQQDYLQNSSQLTFLEKELERQRTLNRENVGARKNFEQAEANYRSTKAMVQSLAAKLRMLGVPPESISNEGVHSTLRIKSPINGYISATNVNLGKEVGAGEVLFEAIDKQHLHIELTVFEQDAPKIRKGQEVTVQPEKGGSPFLASVYLVGKILEGDSRTLNVHAHLKDEAKERELVPGAYVDATIRTGTHSAITVPEKAFVRKGAIGFVYVKKGTDTFHRIQVQPGITTPDKQVEITSATDLTGQQLVTEGAYLLDAEFSKKADQEEEP